jgi:hypothetical protein
MPIDKTCFNRQTMPVPDASNRGSLHGVDGNGENVARMISIVLRKSNDRHDKHSEIAELFLILITNRREATLVHHLAVRKGGCSTGPGRRHRSIVDLPIPGPGLWLDELRL